jgi:hypothetical protein
MQDINQAITNNADRFPVGYVVELSKSEKSELVENFHQFDRLIRRLTRREEHPSILRDPSGIHGQNLGSQILDVDPGENSSPWWVYPIRQMPPPWT